MAKVKGTVFSPRLDYIEKKASPAEQAQIHELLSPELRTQIEQHMLSNQWYPFEYYLELNRAIVQVLGHGQEAILREVGYYSAEVALNGIYKTFFRAGSPGFIIKIATRAWEQYFQNGALRVETHSDKQLTVHFTGIEVLAREHFISTAGWITKVLELSGAKNVRIDIGQFGPALVTLEILWD